MEGLVKGRVVYLVLSDVMAFEINRRRTTIESVQHRLHEQPPWPAGAQAHIGNEVQGGDIVPAMVTACGFGPGGDGIINCKAELDGSDQYWAVRIPFDAEGRPGTWHWMFKGQDTRYDPTKRQPGQPVDLPAAGQQQK